MNNNLYKINEVTQHKYYQVPKELYTNPRYKTVINNDAKMLYALLLFFFKINYLFLSGLDLCCYVWAFSSCS